MKRDPCTVEDDTGAAVARYCIYALFIYFKITVITKTLATLNECPKTLANLLQWFLNYHGKRQYDNRYIL